MVNKLQLQKLGKKLEEALREIDSLKKKLSIAEINRSTCGCNKRFGSPGHPDSRDEY